MSLAVILPGSDLALRSQGLASSWLPCDADLDFQSEHELCQSAGSESTWMARRVSEDDADSAKQA